jgi:hypothetical protein
MNTRLVAIFLASAVLIVVLWAFLAIAIAPSPARAQMQEDYASWPQLRSTFPSTGGGGFTIKGYDPVITGGKCVTTFMAVEADDNPKVYANVIEFEAVPAQGGILCRDGRWRAFEGGASGTTPFRFFLKDGVFRASQ